MHYTSPGGLTLGFKLPLAGIFYGVDSKDSTVTTDFAATFYLWSLFELPTVSLGYRW